MPSAPIAMAPASERPPMIVSAGYFSSRRAPSFQSSHETTVIGPHPAGAPEPAARKPGWHSYAPLLQSAHVGASGRAHRAGGQKYPPADQPVSSRGGEHSVRFR